MRLVLAGLALSLSVETYVHTANNAFTAPGFTAWVLSIGVWMVVLAQRPPDTLLADGRRWVTLLPARVRGSARVGILPLIALAAIMGTAIFFRVHRLDGIPDEMTSDHVEKLLDAHAVAAGHLHVFFPHNGGARRFSSISSPWSRGSPEPASGSCR